MASRTAKSPDLAVSLATKLVAALAAQRDAGRDAYPPTLQRLVQLTDPQAPADLVQRALVKKPFKDRAVVVNIADPQSLVALAEDLDQLADDSRLLESILSSLCSPADPLWPLARLKAAIKNTKLRKPFADAVAGKIRNNALPPSVGCRMEKNKPLLYLQRIPPPPPPPPPKKPEELMAARLLTTLQAQRVLGPDAYPPSLARLIELTSPRAAAPLVKKALAHPTLHGKLLVANTKAPESPVALAEDRQQFCSSSRLLTFLLQAKRQERARACAVESLLSSKSDLYGPFVQAVHGRIDAGTLPPEIGWMWIGKKKQLFFLEDVHGRPAGMWRGAEPARAPETPSARGHAIDFAAALAEAFAHIDRQQGGHNFVSLVELRGRLPMPRDTFDAELRKLRVAGQYTLSAAEGRHGISAEERAAGIVENGTLLLYVSRKRS
jgi:hypothetical protein